MRISPCENNSTDIFIRIQITNRGTHSADCTVLPTLWFYNRWQTEKKFRKPTITLKDDKYARATHERIGLITSIFRKPTR
jgi:hypothetical protein